MNDAIERMRLSAMRTRAMTKSIDIGCHVLCSDVDAVLVRIAEIEAEVERLRGQLVMMAERHSECMTEADRMRPVVDAAVEYVGEDGVCWHECTPWSKLCRAVHMHRWENKRCKEKS